MKDMLGPNISAIDLLIHFLAVPLNSMWTDGSQNSETNFAANSGLEGSSCCIKTGQRGWRGEKCSALLHGVCQYQAGSKNLASLKDIVTTPGAFGIDVAWTVGNEGWAPSLVTVRGCSVKSLNTDPRAGNEEIGEHCTEKEVEAGSEVFLDDLHPFTEYNIILTSALDYFNESASYTVVGRTCQL